MILYRITEYYINIINIVDKIKLSNYKLHIREKNPFFSIQFQMVD